MTNSVMWRESENGRTGRSSAGSELVVMDDHPMVNGPPEMPNIANLSVTRSSRVHFGPKIVNVTQTVHTSEVIKGRILGLELVSANTAPRLRCSVAVFVCWASLVASALAFCIFYFALYKHQTRLDIGLQEPWYLRRDDWQAMPAYEVEFLQLPVRIVLIGHSAANYCTEKYSCIQKVLDIQQDHLRRDFGDIGPNFLLTGNGLLIEGRGANIIGAMVKSWNTRIISVMFMGDYRKDPITESQFDHLNVLLDILLKINVLRPDYVVYGNCQVSTQTVSPGPNIMKNMHHLTHWNSSNSNLYLPLSTYLCNVLKSTTRAERLSCVASLVALIICITLIAYYSVGSKNLDADTIDVAPHEWNITKEMWLGQPYNYTRTTKKYEPIKLVIIQHTVSTECHKFVQCAAELRNIQTWFLKDYSYDIPYNFLVGNDGRIYEGRNWGIEGAHTYSYNRCSLGIGFIGDYREEAGIQRTKVTPLQLNRTLMLLEVGVREGHLDPNYVVVGAKDLQQTESPGGNLYNAIRKWSHYDLKNRFHDKSCDEIWAMTTNQN
ncbi:peptidoglycan recognition protein 3-like [Aphomia sociella]